MILENLKRVDRLLIRFLLLPLLLLTCSALPPLDPKETSALFEKMLSMHLSSPSIDTALVENAYKAYLNQLDPSKIYFLKSEIEKWRAPSAQMLEKGVSQLKDGDFSSFIEMSELMQKAITRQNQIEQKITDKLAKGEKEECSLNYQDNKDWAEDEEQLISRITNQRCSQFIASLANYYDIETRDREKKSWEAQFFSATKQPLALDLTLKALAFALDPHSSYFTPEEEKSIELATNFFGIGVVVKPDSDGLMITEIIKDSPAEKSGQINVKDIIIAVENRSLAGMNLKNSIKLIKGEKGSLRQLTLLRYVMVDGKIEAQNIAVEVESAELIPPKMIIKSKSEPFGNGIIAHLELNSFYANKDGIRSSSSDLEKEIDRLTKTHDVKGIILDLRQNKSDLIDQAKKVAALFLKKSAIYFTPGREKELKRNDSGFSSSEKALFDGPLIILTDKLSVSASEVLTKSLQDYGRALVVGDTSTFGKGSAQTLLKMESIAEPKQPIGSLNITTSLYYTLSGTSPQLEGVKADIVVPGLFADFEDEKIFSNALAAPELPAADPGTLFPNDKSKVVQPVLKSYLPYIDQLKANSALRLKNGYDASSQYEESLNIMKDLLFLMGDKPIGNKKAL